MQRPIEHILRSAAAALLLLAALAAASCIYDDGEEEPDDRTLLGVGFSLPMSLSEAGGDDRYVSGEGYENYIDLGRDGYRIYFFDAENKYIARFVPMFVSPVSGADRYEVLGRADELAGLSDFKIVVLANWPSYPDDSALTPGSTTIDDLCTAETALYDALPSFELNPAAGRTIPFFGIHRYTGLTIAKGTRTTLAEPVTLLRAMAKVELVVGTDGISLSEVRLHGYNKQGYCAPAGVYSQSDYDHSGDWGADYVQRLHLVGGENDKDAASAVADLFRKSGAPRETWVAYVPEYSNTGASDYKSRLRFKLNISGIVDDKVYSLYFADYEEGAVIQPDGAAAAPPDGYFDLWRNNCYRYEIIGVNMPLSELIIKSIRIEDWTDDGGGILEPVQ